MAVVPDTQQARLIQGRMMRCPKCLRQHDVLQYVPLGIMPDFVEETAIIYRCPKCRWLFAPAYRLNLEPVELSDAD